MTSYHIRSSSLPSVLSVFCELRTVTALLHALKTYQHGYENHDFSNSVFLENTAM